MRESSTIAARPVSCTASRATRARAGSRSITWSAAAAWTTMIPTAWATTSWSSRAIRSRSSITARAARCTCSAARAALSAWASRERAARTPGTHAQAVSAPRNTTSPHSSPAPSASSRAAHQIARAAPLRGQRQVGARAVGAHDPDDEEHDVVGPLTRARHHHRGHQDRHRWHERVGTTKRERQPGDHLRDHHGGRCLLQQEGDRRSCAEGTCDHRIEPAWRHGPMLVPQAPRGCRSPGGEPWARGTSEATHRCHSQEPPDGRFMRGARLMLGARRALRAALRGGGRAC